MLLARCDFHSPLLTVIQIGAAQMFALVVSVLNELLLMSLAVSLQVGRHCSTLPVQDSFVAAVRTRVLACVCVASQSGGVCAYYISSGTVFQPVVISCESRVQIQSLSS